MSRTFDRIYSDDQRDAVITAYNDRGIRPARLIAELASRGELEYNGVRLEPFKVAIGTILHYAREQRLKRQGRIDSNVASMPPIDAVEALRRRLVAALDHELAAIEKLQKNKHQGLAERIRITARAAREVQALTLTTGPKAQRTREDKPSQERGASGETGGIAGAMLRDHRRMGGAPMANTPHVVADATEQPAAPAPDPDSEAQVGSPEWIEAERARRMADNESTAPDHHRSHHTDDSALPNLATHVQAREQKKARESGRVGVPGGPALEPRGTLHPSSAPEPWARREWGEQ